MPQENPEKLTLLRGKLSQFLKAVMKALSIELEVAINEGYMSAQKEAVYNEVLQNLPLENSTYNFRTNLSQASDFLQFEFDQLRRINKQ